MFKLRPQDIEGLGPERFVMFVNDLIWAEANKQRILPAKVKLTLRINEGGADARVEDDAGQSDGRWIPNGASVWEFKSGDIGPADIKKEVEKRKDALVEGASFVIAIARDYGDERRNERERALAKSMEALGLSPDKGLLRTGSDLARWAREHPALVLFFNVPIGGCLRVRDWEQSEFHQGEFVPDSPRLEVIEKIVDFFAHSGSPVHFRLEGRRGVGKTRVVLEAMRADGLRERVLYAQEPAAVPPEFWAWARSHTTVSGVLIVDECEWVEAQRLKEQADTCEGRIRLITIGAGEPFLGTPTSTHVYLDELDEETTRELLRRRFRGLSDEQGRWIARLARGYVRLAVACAEAVVRNPKLDAVALAALPGVRETLDVLLPDAGERRAMQALSLLTRIGVEEDVAVEGQVVSEFLGVSWAEFREVIQRCWRRGLVQKRGRYRYVTPDLLAAWLAAEVWSNRGDEMVNLLGRIPTEEGRKALLERLKDLGPHPKARDVVQALLSTEGLFPDLAALDDDRRARVFHSLALADPEGAVRALDRIFQGRSTEELQNFRKGRRWTVWSLDFVKWFRETFFQAGRLLLALAEAENEQWANNSTGIWKSIFLVHLGGTEVPALERHTLIERALASESPKQRQLGLQAISAVLSSHESRSSGDETASPRVVPPEWRPRTWGDLWAVYRSALGLLDGAMGDHDHDVARAAREVFYGSARTVVRAGLADEVISRLETLEPVDDVERRRMRETVESILQYQSQALRPEQRERLVAVEQRAVGKSFRDRLRRWVGRWSFGDWNIQEREGGPPPQERAAALAEEAIRTPELLRDEVEWLSSDEAHNVGYFGRRLGELDEGLTWLQELAERAKAGKGHGFLACYLWGRSDASGSAWVDALLDEWIETERTLAPVVLGVVWRRGPSTKDMKRVTRLVQKGWLEPKALGVLRYGRWTADLALDDFIDMLSALLHDEGEEATEAALGAVADRLESDPKKREKLAPHAWQLLGRLSTLGGGMARYFWGKVAKRYAADDPARVAEIILKTIATCEVLFHEGDEPTEVLGLVTTLAPHEVWQRAGGILLRGDLNSYRLQLTLEHWYVALIDPDILLEWVEVNRPDGPRVIASLTQPEGTPLARLPRDLLVRFGDDEVVQSRLHGNLISGSYSGSTVVWLQGKLQMAKEWLRDPHPQVQGWAAKVVGSLDAWIRQEQRREEEDDLRR